MSPLRAPKAAIIAVATLAARLGVSAARAPQVPATPAAQIAGGAIIDLEFTM